MAGYTITFTISIFMIVKGVFGNDITTVTEVNVVLLVYLNVHFF
jgi:hypothetical protein